MPVGTQATVKGLTPEHGPRRRGADHPRQHLPPRPAARRRTDRATSAGCTSSWAGTGRSSPTPAGSRSSAWPPDPQDHRPRRVFRSHIDGALLELTPERAVDIQENLGSDIAMVLDECPPARRRPGAGHARGRPADGPAGPSAAGRHHTRADQALFAIVQGGTEPRPARRECAEPLVAMDFPGYALGGFSVGESPDAMHAALPAAAGAAARGQAALPDGRRPAGGPARRGRRRASTCSTA